MYKDLVFLLKYWQNLTPQCLPPPPKLAFKHLAGQLHFAREGLMLEKKVVSYATYHYSCRAFRQQPRALKEPKQYSLFAPQHICLGTRNEPEGLLIRSPKMYKGIWRMSTQLLHEFIQTPLCILVLFTWSAWVNSSISYFAYRKADRQNLQTATCSQEVQSRLPQPAQNILPTRRHWFPYEEDILHSTLLKNIHIDLKRLKDSRDPSSWWKAGHQRWRLSGKNTSPEPSYTGSWPHGNHCFVDWVTNKGWAPGASSAL